MTASAGNTMMGGAHIALGATRASAGAGSVGDVADHANSVDSRLLLNGHKVVTITHNGVLYRLQSTKLGKLILTK